MQAASNPTMQRDGAEPQSLDPAADELHAFEFCEATVASALPGEARPGADRLCGLRQTFRVGWRVDSGPYRGQWAMLIPPDCVRDLHLDISWIPSGHLTQVRPLGNVPAERGVGPSAS